MIEQGDAVKIQSGMYEGKRGEVAEVDWEAGTVTLAVEGFGERREVELAVRDVQTLTGSDEELVEKVASSIRESVWQVYEVRQQLWWARRMADGRDPSVELIESFREFRASLLDEYDNQVENVLTTARQKLEAGLTPSEWLSNEADQVRRSLRDQADKLKREFFREVTPASELERLDEEAQRRADNSSFLDRDAARQQLVQRRTSSMLDEALELWQACEDLEEP